MDIQHTARAISVSDPVRAYAEQKFQSACSRLERFAGTHLHLVYEKEGHAHHGEHQAVHALLTVPHAEPINVRESAQDLYAAIDLAADELSRQVDRYRDKQNAHERARPARR